MGMDICLIDKDLVIKLHTVLHDQLCLQSRFINLHFSKYIKMLGEKLLKSLLEPRHYGPALTLSAFFLQLILTMSMATIYICCPNLLVEKISKFLVSMSICCFQHRLSILPPQTPLPLCPQLTERQNSQSSAEVLSGYWEASKQWLDLQLRSQNPCLLSLSDTVTWGWAAMLICGGDINSVLLSLFFQLLLPYKPFYRAGREIFLKYIFILWLHCCLGLFIGPLVLSR